MSIPQFYFIASDVKVMTIGLLIIALKSDNRFQKSKTDY